VDAECVDEACGQADSVAQTGEQDGPGTRGQTSISQVTSTRALGVVAFTKMVFLSRGFMAVS